MRATFVGIGDGNVVRGGPRCARTTLTTISVGNVRRDGRRRVPYDVDRAMCG